MSSREQFSSRSGFLLVTAGCVISLANIWRLPYTIANNGGILFLLLYIFCLFVIGLPCFTMELAVGRGSRLSLGTSLEALEVKGSKTHRNKYWFIPCNYIVMSIYSVVTGMMFYYGLKLFVDGFGQDLTEEMSQDVISDVMDSFPIMMMSTMIIILIGFGICAMGLKKGVERTLKPMMVVLFVMLVYLTVVASTLDGFGAGITAFLAPDFEAFSSRPFTHILIDALTEAFFTLGIGIGIIQVMGSYMKSAHTLLSCSLPIMALNVLAAVLAGCILYPLCYTYGVDPSLGPKLLFVQLIPIFSQSHVEAANIWGGVFFMVLAFISFSTLVAFFENVTAICMECYKLSRRRSIILNAGITLVASLPCVLGFNAIPDWYPVGSGTSFLEIEECLVSDNLVAGGFYYVFFILSTKNGWGYDNYLRETNKGEGMKMPYCAKYVFRFIIPIFLTVHIVCRITGW